MGRETTSLNRNREDRLFGTLAIKEGRITPAQLEEALEIQKRLGPGARKVGQILVEKGYLTDALLEEILDLQRREVKPLAADPSRGGLFGQIALDQGFVTAAQLDECLDEQQQLSRSGAPMMLGQILLRKGHLQTDQFLQVLKIQRNRVLRCTGCDTFYKIEPEDEGTKFACRRCGTIMNIPVPETLHGLATGQALPGLPGGPRTGAGAHVGRYVILEELGRGGMGIVYKAVHRDLNKVFAVKVLRESEFSSNEMLTRFRREAQASARLAHPNIVAIHDAGEEAGVHYIVMDCIEGDPLTVHLARKFKLRDMIVRYEKICRAVQHAHEHGIIHRDLKPANVMIDHQGEPHVMDFGLAKFLDKPQSALTRAGAFLGTPFYMAPEQIRAGSGAVDARTDVYSLGILLYEILCGRTPYGGENSVEVFNKILVEEPPPPRDFNPKVHPDLQTICLRAVEKQPEARYPSAGELADDLRRWLDGEPIHARPVPWIRKLLKRARKNRSNVVSTASVAAVAVVLVLLATYLVRDAGEFRRLLGDGKRLFEEGDYREAVSRFESARRLDDNNPEVVNWLALARARLAAKEEDDDARRRRDEQRRQAEPRLLDAQTMLDDLPQEILQERFTPAQVAERCAVIERLLGEALRTAPDHEEVLYLLGRTREFRNDFPGAIDAFTRALGRMPRHYKALVERAQLQFRRYAMGGNLGLRPAGFPLSPAQQEDRTQALLDFRASWTYLREPHKAGLAQAAILFLDGKLAEAAAALDPHLDRYPADSSALRLRGIARIALGDPAGAEKDLAKAARYRPADAGLWIWIAKSRAARKDDDGADEALAAAMQVSPTDPWPLMARAVLKAGRGRLEDAVADYRRATELAPTNAEAFAGIGALRLRQENGAEALVALTRAIQLEAGDPWPYALRAEARSALGKPEEAVQDADSAVSLAPESAPLLERRGLLLFRLGRHDAALKDLERVLKMDPTAAARLEAAVKEAKSKLGRP